MGVTQTAGRLKSPNTCPSLSQSIFEEEDVEEIKGVLNAVSAFDQVTPEDMAREQCKDPILGIVCPYITVRENLKSLVIPKLNQRL